MNHRRVDPLRLIHPTFECRFMESPTLRFRVNFAKQLDICSAGSTTQTFRSDFQSTVIAARHWHANAACRTEAPDHHQYPWQTLPHPSGTDQPGGVPDLTESHCGAVDRCATTTGDSISGVREIYARNRRSTATINPSIRHYLTALLRFLGLYVCA